jgi:CheY-like chemotaxis protein
MRPDGGPRMETILVVDDELDVCELARDCLVTAGYRVLEATDGEEALRIAEAYPEPIHLLLTDVVMPRLNGVEVAGRLTRQRPDTKVLYMSGFAVVGAQTEHLSGPGLQPPNFAEAVQPRGPDSEGSGGPRASCAVPLPVQSGAYSARPVVAMSGCQARCAGRPSLVQRAK